MQKKLLVVLAVAIAVAILAYFMMQQKEEAPVVAEVSEEKAEPASEAINVGIVLGFTGPIESLTPVMADSAELAFAEASSSGKLLGGKTITPLRADSTCVDAAAATAAAIAPALS